MPVLHLFHLDYSNSLFAGLPDIRPWQLIQNASACLNYSLPRLSHVTPLLISLHWLTISACKFKTSVQAYHPVNGTARLYLQKIIRSNTPSKYFYPATSGCPASLLLHNQVSFTAGSNP
ncbi:hypothetical protein ANANG_G00102230 [Anguilla anguilla]|uniref:Uncharacterized protein n=1 Tax=Anguilla anguilla TaxID=7936 RepID=A0A9D3MIM7_ANGAN|nr:hypothetical protein ANANG_G00102230 [Anguilla anguilla]